MTDRERKEPEKTIADTEENVEYYKNELCRYEDTLCKIKNWVKAYPAEQFPEMKKDDWKKAEDALKKCGIEIGRISASNMRHVLDGVNRIIGERRYIK